MIPSGMKPMANMASSPLVDVPPLSNQYCSVLSSVGHPLLLAPDCDHVGELKPGGAPPPLPLDVASLPLEETDSDICFIDVCDEIYSTMFCKSTPANRSITPKHDFHHHGRCYKNTGRGGGGGRERGGGGMAKEEDSESEDEMGFGLFGDEGIETMDVGRRAGSGGGGGGGDGKAQEKDSEDSSEDMVLGLFGDEGTETMGVGRRAGSGGGGGGGDGKAQEKDSEDSSEDMVLGLYGNIRTHQRLSLNLAKVIPTFKNAKIQYTRHIKDQEKLPKCRTHGKRLTAEIPAFPKPTKACRILTCMEPEDRALPKAAEQADYSKIHLGDHDDVKGMYEKIGAAQKSLLGVNDELFYKFSYFILNWIENLEKFPLLRGGSSTNGSSPSMICRHPAHKPGF